MALRINILCEVGPNRDHAEKLKGHVLNIADTETSADRQIYVLYRERIRMGKTELQFDLNSARYLDPAVTDIIFSQRGNTMPYNDLGPFVSNEGLDVADSVRQPFRNHLNNPAIFGNAYFVAAHG